MPPRERARQNILSTIPENADDGAKHHGNGKAGQISARPGGITGRIKGAFDGRAIAVAGDSWLLKACTVRAAAMASPA